MAFSLRQRPWQKNKEKNYEKKKKETEKETNNEKEKEKEKKRRRRRRENEKEEGEGEEKLYILLMFLRLLKQLLGCTRGARHDRSPGEKYIILIRLFCSQFSFFTPFSFSPILSISLPPSSPAPGPIPLVATLRPGGRVDQRTLQYGRQHGLDLEYGRQPGLDPRLRPGVEQWRVQARLGPDNLYTSPENYLVMSQNPANNR